MITRGAGARWACLKTECVLSESSREGTTGGARNENGFCRIWWNNGVNPIGTGWTRVATAPDFSGAWAAQDAAVKKGKCK
jgi:hypothetical protein